MIIINVAEHGSIERALKLLKQKFNNTQTLKELRSRKEFVKPCETRRQTLISAKYRRSLNND
jgi:small subunit ribosomal protein S21